MKRILFLLTACFISFLSNGQVRLITGRVIDELDLTPIPEVRIQDRDTVRLGTTDTNGNFEIQLPSDRDELLLSLLGMEWTSIKVPDGCSRLEIIMMIDSNYDFMTTRRINRKRYKKFKGLTGKHHQAHENGLFESDSPCFTYIFHKY